MPATPVGPAPASGVAAGHNDEAASSVSLGRADQRRIDEAAATCLHRLGDLQRRARLGGRTVGVNRTASDALEQAAGEDDLLPLRRAGDAEEDDVGSLVEVGGRLGLDGTAADQVLDWLAVTVAENGQGIALSTMFLAMPWPIMPTPLKPIRSFAVMGATLLLRSGSLPNMRTLQNNRSVGV